MTKLSKAFRIGKSWNHSIFSCI